MRKFKGELILRTIFGRVGEPASASLRALASLAAISPIDIRKLYEIGKEDLEYGLNTFISKFFRGVRNACFSSTVLLSGYAYAEPFETFSGSASCIGDPVTFSILIARDGPLSMTEFDDPCRSGSGRCNDSYQWEFDHTERANGTARITTLSSSAGFKTTSYDLQGIAADIPPPGWNRQQKMRHEYRFSAINQDQSPNAFKETELVLRRYTDIRDGEDVVVLSLAGHACADTDAIYRRFYQADLNHDATE